jgi:hypothetical protein
MAHNSMYIMSDKSDIRYNLSGMLNHLIHHPTPTNIIKIMMRIIIGPRYCSEKYQASIGPEP